MMARVWRYLNSLQVKHVIWGLLALLVLLACLLILNGQHTEELQQTVEQQRVSIAQLQEEKQALINSSKQLLLAQSIDKQTIESIRKSLRDQRQELGELEKELKFYRGLMTPDDRQRGLSIREFHVEKDERPRAYLFSLVMQQLTTQHKQLTGHVSVTITGKQNDIDFSHPLSSLSEDVGEDGIALSFKYFQIIEGRIVLPEGFHPIAIMIYAESEGKTKQKVRQTIAWPDYSAESLQLDSL